jgi:hypothetical protein
MIDWVCGHDEEPASAAGAGSGARGGVRGRGRLRAVVAVGLVAALACNRAAVRIPGASTPFPESASGYRAKTPLPVGLTVARPVDARASHYGERVAGTRWRGCRTDPFWATRAEGVIRQQLATDLAASGLFARVTTDDAAPEPLVLHTEVDAFCSQAIGFLYLRVAGISAMRFEVRQGDRMLFGEKIERVVTDADPEYTGLRVATIEQAMQRTMADSLRLVLADLLARLDAELGAQLAVRP